MELIRRVEAATATKREFEGHPIEWGKRDCLKMVAFVLRHLNHKNPTKGVLKYSSMLGAVRAFRKAGYPDLAAAVDAYGLTRIPPASALPGDILAFPTEAAATKFGVYALAVSLGSDKALAFAVPNEAGQLTAGIGPVSPVIAIAEQSYGLPVLAWRSV